MGDVPIKFLEPAIGTGAFYSALLQTVGEARVNKALGFDVDARFVEAANRLWQGTPLEVVQQDFTKTFGVELLQGPLENSPGGLSRPCRVRLLKLKHVLKPISLSMQWR